MHFDTLFLSLFTISPNRKYKCFSIIFLIFIGIKHVCNFNFISFFQNYKIWEVITIQYKIVIVEVEIEIIAIFNHVFDKFILKLIEIQLLIFWKIINEFEYNFQFYLFEEFFF